MENERKATLFGHIVRLRRVARALPEDRGLSEVRAWLESELGETVSRRLAARLLGVSHTALERWIKAGDIPTVHTVAGRVEVPVPAVLDLYDRVERERTEGRRNRHVLEPVLLEDRERARDLDPRGLVTDVDGGAGHRLAELRGLAYHRALARRLSRELVNEARYTVRKWRAQDSIDPRHAEAWEELLTLPLADIKRLIGEDTETGRDLRQSSPFAGMLSEQERRRILEQVR